MLFGDWFVRNGTRARGKGAVAIQRKPQGFLDATLPTFSYNYARRGWGADYEPVKT